MRLRLLSSDHRTYYGTFDITRNTSCILHQQASSRYAPARPARGLLSARYSCFSGTSIRGLNPANDHDPIPRNPSALWLKFCMVKISGPVWSGLFGSQFGFFCGQLAGTEKIIVLPEKDNRLKAGIFTMDTSCQPGES